MAADNQAAGKKGPIVWQAPKMQHAREFMLRLTQTPIPLVIVCMRAKYPMEEVIKDGRKDWARSKVLSPKQSEDILFEMFVHGWLSVSDHKFHGTKYTRDAMRKIFIDSEPITIDTGKRLAEWAAGGQPKAAALAEDREPGDSQPARTTVADAAAPAISSDQVVHLETLCSSWNISLDSLRRAAGVAALSEIKTSAYDRAITWVNAAIEKRKAA